jgi:hypothetical protein
MLAAVRKTKNMSRRRCTPKNARTSPWIVTLIGLSKSDLKMFFFCFLVELSRFCTVILGPGGFYREIIWIEIGGGKSRQNAVWKRNSGARDLE